MSKMSEKKDKKRRLLWILFPLLALIGVGALFFISRTGRPEGQSLPKELPTMIATKTSDNAGADLASPSSMSDGTTIQDVASQSKSPKGQPSENVETHKITATSQNTKKKAAAYSLSSKNGNDAQVQGDAIDHKERSKNINKDLVQYPKNIDNTSTRAQKTANEIITNGSVVTLGSRPLPTDMPNISKSTDNTSETKSTKPNSVDNLLSNNKTLDHLDFLPGVSMVALEAMNSDIPKLRLNHTKNSFIKPSRESYLGKTDLYMYGGYSHWQLLAVADQGVGTESIINVSEKSLPSFNMGVRADVSLSKNSYVSTGIGCMSLYSVYDYNSVKSIKVTQQNVVTQIRYDLISSNSSNIYGDTTVMASQSRQARARNQIFNVSIPIVVGLQKSVGNWTLKGGVGTMFSVFTKAKGKTEYAENYVNVDHNGLFQNTLGVAFTGDLSAQYQWTDRFFIGAQISATHFANTFAIANKSISLPTIYGFNITSGMKF